MQGVEEKIFLMCVHGELLDCLCRQAPTTPSQQPSSSLDHLPKEGGKSMEISSEGTFVSSFKGHDCLPSIWRKLETIQEWGVSLEYQEVAAMDKHSYPSSLLPLVNGDKSVRLGQIENWNLHHVCSGWRMGSVSWRQHLLVAWAPGDGAQSQRTPTFCSSSPGADGKGAAARGRLGRVAPRNVLSPRLHFLTFTWVIQKGGTRGLSLLSAAGGTEKRECQWQKQHRAPVQVQTLSVMSKAFRTGQPAGVTSFPQTGCRMNSCHNVTRLTACSFFTWNCLFFYLLFPV